MSRGPKVVVLLSGGMNSCVTASITREKYVRERSLGTPIGGNEILSTYVPFRNTHFLAVAVSWAEAWSCYQFEDAACGACDSGGCGSVHLPKQGSAILSPIGTELRDNN